jgi:hypothetical protein
MIDCETQFGERISAVLVVILNATEGRGVDRATNTLCQSKPVNALSITKIDLGIAAPLPFSALRLPRQFKGQNGTSTINSFDIMIMEQAISMSWILTLRIKHCE